MFGCGFIFFSTVGTQKWAEPYRAPPLARQRAWPTDGGMETVKPRDTQIQVSREALVNISAVCRGMCTRVFYVYVLCEYKLSVVH